MRVLTPSLITDATLYSSSVAETDHPAWSAATAYSAGTRVIRTTGVHRIFERLIAGTTTTAPESDPTNWLDAGPTNRWAMLDDSPSSATSQASPLSVYLTPGAVNDIVLMGVVGTQVQVYSGSTGATLVRTVAVAAPVAPATTRTVVITGLGIAAGNRVGVVVSGSGAVQVAHLAVGTFSTLGQTLPGVEVGITDYSVISTDDFGATSVTVRPYSRWISGTYRVPAADVDRVVAEVESLQSKITWWEVDGAYECLQTLGWPKSHQLLFRGQAHSLVSFRLEGLSRDDAVVQAGEVLPSGSGSTTSVQASMPLVEGLGVRLVAGNIEFGWTPCRTTGYIATEIRTGATWAAGVTAFYGLANRWVWAWPADGIYQLRWRHVGSTSTSTADAVADVVVAGNTITVTFSIVWDDGTGSDVIWDDGTGGDALWGTSLTRDPRIGTSDLQDGAATGDKIASDSVGTGHLQPNSATEVYRVEQAEPWSFSPAA